MKYSTVIFDLDGTLLDTIDDLAGSANHALVAMGYEALPLDLVRSYVGHGIRDLVSKCIPDGLNNPKFEECFAEFKRHYYAHCADATRPYAGMVELVKKLSEKEYKLAIVSNKADAPVNTLNDKFFGNYISLAIGERPELKKKPDPAAVEFALKELGSEKFESVYIGDSEVDVKTAENSGIDCILVSWGFRSKQTLIDAGAKVIVDTPEELLAQL